jgi:fumarylpyruvate hydrolase
MTEYVHHPAPQPAAEIAGDTRAYPVHRIFCVGRNYAAHAAEMGNEVDREAPFYFTKSAHALCPSGRTIPYPPGTQDCHFEMEFVVALGAGGADIALDDAMSHVWGYGCGIDLTRRDLQAAAKDKRRPWDLGKDFEQSAILAPLVPAAQWGEIGAQRIHLSRDGAVAQDAALSDMVWSVPEIIAHLSRFYTLRAGDLIYTGTPAGVGPVAPGSVLEGGIDGLPPVHLTIADPAA